MNNLGEVVTQELSANEPTENQEQKNCCQKRTKLIISVLEKINMLFLIFFVCYLSWTIPANYGLFMSNKASSNSTITENSSRKIQNEDWNSTERRLNAALLNFTEFSYKSFQRKEQTKNGRKHSSKKRKQLNSRRRKIKFSPTDINEVENPNEENTHRVRHGHIRQNENCLGCSRRRKSRRKKKKNKNYFGEKLKPTTIRHIIEQVAREALVRGSGNSWDHDNDIFPVDTSYNFDDDSNNVKFDNRKDNSKQESSDKDNDRPWNSWGSCSVTCGVGQRERTRSCGPTCKEVESMVCFAPSCENKEDNVKNSVVDFYLWEKEGFIPTPQTKEYIDPEVDACGEWMECNKEAVSKYLEKADLPSCPCKYPVHLEYNDKVWDKAKKHHYTWKDASGKEDALYAYKPGALYCIRSKLYHGTPTLAAQHCCYDESLALISRGKSAGTPNLISPEMSPELHQKVDLDPWIICKGDWTRYNQVISPNNGLSCTENPNKRELKRQIKDAQNY